VTSTPCDDPELDTEADRLALSELAVGQSELQDLLDGFEELPLDTWAGCRFWATDAPKAELARRADLAPEAVRGAEPDDRYACRPRRRARTPADSATSAQGARRLEEPQPKGLGTGPIRWHTGWSQGPRACGSEPS
jgi:hypothetical protein